MAHDALLAELDRRKAAARAMGGPDKLAKRKERGQLNARGATGRPGRQGQLHRDRPARRVRRVRCRCRRHAARRQDHRLRQDRRPRRRRRGQRLHHQGRVDQRDQLEEDGLHPQGLHRHAACPSSMSANRPAPACPTPWAPRAWATLLGNDITQFRRMRDTPWVAAALDTSFGSSAWLCCCSDFAVMKKGSIMSVSSPRLVSMAIGEKVDLEELGGWRLHAEQTGLIDHFVDTDAEAMAVIRRFLSYMPSHNGEAAAGGAGDGRVGRGAGAHPRHPAGEAHPGLQHEEDRRGDRRPRQLLRAQAALRPARRSSGSRGWTASRSASSPTTRRSAAARCRPTPAARCVDFTVLCDSFNIPLVRLIDTPGFVVGHGGRAPRRARPHHELHERDLPDHRAADHRDRAQGLWPRLCRDGRRRAQRQDGRVADAPRSASWTRSSPPTSCTTCRPGEEGFEEALAQIQKDLEVWDMARIFSAQDVIKPQETRAYLIRMFDVYRRRRTGGVGKHLMRTWPTSY